MWFLIIFLISHWFLSLFFHSFFLHRYASHQLYTTTKGWERFFYFSTWMTLGSSYLVPRAYGVMHRMHHQFSDTEKDPHSPRFFRDVFNMMIHTGRIFRAFVSKRNLPDPQFTREYLPVWNRLDRIGHHTVTRVLFALVYISIYIVFAPGAWWFLLIPIHILMGPIQGAIVNWCGHKYGYRNYKSDDHSKNSSPFGLILMGELFQNNHHHQKYNPNFARRWFEFDSTYLVMRLLNKLKIIHLLPIESHSETAPPPIERAVYV